VLRRDFSREVARLIDCSHYLPLSLDGYRYLRIGLERMRWGQCSKLVKSVTAARALVAIAAAIAFLCSPARAVQPPPDHCRVASKVEYDSAKKQFLLRNRFGAYIRTGHIWRRHYWYCQL
jgi:hypothetical protein